MGHHGPLIFAAPVQVERRISVVALAWGGAAGASMAMVSSGMERLAVPVAAVLGYAATTDWRERRVPRWSMRLGAAALAASLAAVSWHRDDWTPAIRAIAAALGVLVVLGWLWWTRPTVIGLGDVRALALAFAAAAAISWQATLRVLYATLAAAGGLAAWSAVARRVRVHGSFGDLQREKSTVPFVPPLCAGFVLGLGLS